MSEQDRITFSEACKELQISEAELEKLVAAGEIASVKEGDTLFFKSDAISQFKKSKKTEPTIILSDDEMDLLDDAGDISLDDLDLGDLGGDEAAASEPAAAAGAEAVSLDAGGDDALEDLDDLSLDDLGLDDDVPEPTATAATSDAPTDASGDDGLDDLDLSELSLEDEPAEAPAAEAGDDLDVTMEDDISLDLGDDPVDTANDTVLNLDGLLDEDDGGSEATTPVPGMELDFGDTSDDITMEGTVTDDDTILDTDVLDLSDDSGDFEFDATESAAAATASTMLRGGGARTMQMKRVPGTPAMTTVLLLTGVLLLVPLAVLFNVYYQDKPSADIGNDSAQWVGEYNYLKGAIESTADTIHGLFK